MAEAAAVLVILVDLEAMTHHFADQPPVDRRGFRYAHMEVGALAQNVYLQATAMELGVALVGGFEDDTVAAAVYTPTGLSPAALICIGNPKSP